MREWSGIGEVGLDVESTGEGVPCTLLPIGGR